MPMKAHIAAVQAAGLRRVAADLDRVWVDCLRGSRTDDVPAEEFLGSMLAAPVLRALAAELALKAIAIDDFTASRYVGEMPPGSKPTFAYGDDLDVALQDLIAVFEELPTSRSVPSA